MAYRVRGYRCLKSGFPIDFDRRPYDRVTYYGATLWLINKPAQCVAARRRKSDWGQLGGWSYALGNVTWHAWHERNCVSLCTARAVLILGGSIPTRITFLFVDQISAFFLFNVGAIVVDKICFRFLISRSTLEIFVVKVQSCPKLRRIFCFFCPFKFLGCGPP